MRNAQIIAFISGCDERRLRDISETTGIPMPTLHKIRYGQTANPRAGTLDRLMDYIDTACTRNERAAIARM